VVGPRRDTTNGQLPDITIVTTAAIDEMFDKNPKEHILRHNMAVAMVQGAVMDAFATSSPMGD
jgi:hypothetical protein